MLSYNFKLAKINKWKFGVTTKRTILILYWSKYGALGFMLSKRFILFEENQNNFYLNCFITLHFFVKRPAIVSEKKFFVVEKSK